MLAATGKRIVKNHDFTDRDLFDPDPFIRSQSSIASGTDSTYLSDSSSNRDSSIRSSSPDRFSLRSDTPEIPLTNGSGSSFDFSFAHRPVYRPDGPDFTQWERTPYRASGSRAAADNILRSGYGLARGVRDPPTATRSAQPARQTIARNSGPSESSTSSSSQSRQSDSRRSSDDRNSQSSRSSASSASSNNSTASRTSSSAPQTTSKPLSNASKIAIAGLGVGAAAHALGSISSSTSSAITAKYVADKASSTAITINQAKIDQQNNLVNRATNYMSSHGIPWVPGGLAANPRTVQHVSGHNYVASPHGVNPYTYENTPTNAIYGVGSFL